MSAEDCGSTVVAGANMCCSKVWRGGRPGQYCVGNFTLDMYNTLLQRRQDVFRKICWISVFLQHHTTVSDILPEVIFVNTFITAHVT